VENLRKRYAIPNTPKIHQLKTDIAACKQGGLEVVEFYSKLMGMWSELNNYVKIPRCTCGKCECDVGGKVARLMEEEHTHQFLMGLEDECYATVKSQVLAMDPLPSLDRIFNMIQQEEHHKSLMLRRDNRTETAMAFATREKSNVAEKGSCRHCGRYGHDESNCYKIIGYPLDWGSHG